MIYVLQHQRIARRPILTRPVKVERISPRKPASAVISLLKEGGRSELFFLGILLLALSASLALALPRLFAGGARITLPEFSDREALLAQYLIPEDTLQKPQSRLDAGLIKSLKITSYTVAPGDTLSSISQRYGLVLDTVISFNEIRDARSLKEGIALSLPNANGLKYRVARGDTLGAIAERFGVPLNNLLDWNALSSEVIKPAQELFIPNARLSEHELNRVLGKLFVFPVAGRISSTYGVRLDPFTGMRRFHNGLDIAGDLGTPIRAAMNGTVIMMGYNAIYGKYIILKHPEGYQTLYGHLDEFVAKKGQKVSQGQVIAKMGSTGYSTGIHVHFSIFQKGEPVDPFKFLH